MLNDFQLSSIHNQIRVSKLKPRFIQKCRKKTMSSWLHQSVSEIYHIQILWKPTKIEFCTWNCTSWHKDPRSCQSLHREADLLRVNLRISFTMSASTTIKRHTRVAIFKKRRPDPVTEAPCHRATGRASQPCEMAALGRRRASRDRFSGQKWTTMSQKRTAKNVGKSSSVAQLWEFSILYLVYMMKSKFWASIVRLTF